MRAAARDDRACDRRAGPGAHGASMHYLAAGNGDIDWQLLEPRWRKGERVVTKLRPGSHCIRKTMERTAE